MIEFKRENDGNFLILIENLNLFDCLTFGSFKNIQMAKNR